MRTVSFSVLHADPHSQARIGRLQTPHGVVDTPAFMPVGTAGAVKSMLPTEVAATGAQVVLGNTFHLMHRPGHRRIERLGGLHRFSGWEGTILTDSGGFQVLSLANLNKITEAGVQFRSPYDGSRQDITPEISIEVQEALGTDIAMAFDECPPHDVDRAYMQRSMDRTTRWLDRCLAARRHPDRTSLFGIVQGGAFEDLRKQHTETLLERDLDGYAVGGVAIGESKDDMDLAVATATPMLPEDRPRYLMGVGYPDDLVRSVALGIDMFDCVVPTRNARTGRLFTWQGQRVVKHARYTEDERPIDETCECPTCARFSRAYIRYLWLTKEMLVHRLTTMHNLWFMQRLMDKIREATRQGTLTQLLADVQPLTKLAEDD